MTKKLSTLFFEIIELFRYLIIGVFVFGSGVVMLAGNIFIIYSVQSDLPFPVGGTSLAGGWFALVFSLGIIIGGNIIIYKNFSDENFKDSKIHKLGLCIVSFALAVMSTTALLLTADGLFQIEISKILFWIMFGTVALINFTVAYKSMPKIINE